MIDLKERIFELEVTIDNLIRMNAAERIVCALKKIAPDSQEFYLPMSKGVLSLKIGIEQETFSRAIKKLPAYGAKIEEKAVFIDKNTTRRKVCDFCAGRDRCKAY